MKGVNMNLIIVLILGGIIGWLGARLVDREEGIIASVFIGIVGAFIGSFLSSIFSGGSGGFLAFSWPSIIWALIGSVIFAAMLNGFQHGHRSQI
jgi:uncharacterized membrane protein YeaQ/YmgE (transglycosylase-associated protein family)